MTIKPICRTIFLLLHVSLYSQSAYLQGQLSGWLNVTDGMRSHQTGVRYLPAIFAETYLDERLTLDAELSLTAEAWRNISPGSGSARVDAYRAWLRLASSQMEIRAGLQKINFGPAKILRPLKWFDRIDPRDPQQLTDGVYGLLAKYTCLNNANFWLWGLYGNDGSKGLEIVPTKENSFEFGGRVQHPIATGELAVTLHHRVADPQALQFMSDVAAASENRFALDGIWDAGVGLWFEAVVVHQHISVPELQFQNFLALGTDYTFEIGSGLHILAEHLWLSAGDEVLTADERNHTTAVLADYRLTLLDRVTLIVTRLWQTKKWSRFASWGRVYDNWSFYLNMFWNPEQADYLLSEGASSAFAVGKGLQLLVVLNH
jgi:hypothetical protein